MKNAQNSGIIVLLLILSVINASCNNTQAKQSKGNFKEISLSEIATQLYKGKYFKTNQQIVWEPSASDKDSFSVSSDGFCYTKLDTTVSFKTDKDYVVIILSTIAENYDCHACRPTSSYILFEKTGSGYTLLNFKKNFISAGSYGIGPKWGIKKIGRNNYAIMLSGSDGGQGESHSWETFYDMKSLRELFSISTDFTSFDMFSNNEAIADSSGGGERISGEQISSEYELIEADKDYYDILVLTNENGNKTSVKYVFDNVSYSYKEIKK